jgi:hypothetical protein
MHAPDAGFPTKGISFATVTNFKGLENRFIALTDIDDLDGSEYAKAVVYVGMSRARAGLWVGLNANLKKRQAELTSMYLPQVLQEMGASNA